MAIVQIRHDTEGRAYYRPRKLAAGKTPMEALRSLKRRLSDVVYRQLVADQLLRQPPQEAGPGGHLGATTESSADNRPPRWSSLRKSHFPDPPPPTLPPPQPTASSTTSTPIADRPEETRRASAGAGPSLPTIALAWSGPAKAPQSRAAPQARRVSDPHSGPWTAEERARTRAAPVTIAQRPQQQPAAQPPSLQPL